ncbi:HD domain-containing protein [Roseitranquillus sediminis]|uniref:HD domain-containing protein n=1 Tax=Roseitranquillus sediminis TaxID=2809051 RepID=UPI001D0C4187|nr:HD domain-containing protein [Roseitranquillus sediminis]MBM9593888.1 HD domain-containing protein [Roseitranquillus sediminis]
MVLSEAGIRALFPEIDEISDAELRRNVADIWIEVAAEAAWDRLEDVPKNLDAERDRRLTDHIRGVTRMALALAEIGEREQGTPYNRDYLIACCLLHDVSKIVETEPDLEGRPTDGPALPARKSALGAKIQHAAYATHKVFEKGLPLEIAHVVLTHTHASNMRSTSVEGAYLFYADYADSDAAIHKVGGRTFAERWHLG